ncbi:hypothetical protein HN51_043375 [Arachis hypogaea]
MPEEIASNHINLSSDEKLVQTPSPSRYDRLHTKFSSYHPLLLMGERRGLNPRVVDSQSTALIHLATSAPTPAQVLVSIYDQIFLNSPMTAIKEKLFPRV